MIDTPSPNHDDRRGQPVSMLVLHYTGTRTMAEALALLTSPQAKVSSHYLVEESGTIHALVPEERRAWHAGLSHWRGVTDVNAVSIGIEIANPGHEWGYRPFSSAQMQALIPLCQQIVGRHSIPARNVVGHSDIAPARKQDPGELFDWGLLARHGVGVAPPVVDPAAARPGSALDTLSGGDHGEPVRALQADLKAWGYGLDQSGSYDAPTVVVVTAFQRHFRPRLVGGVADAETRAILAALLERPAS